MADQLSAQDWVDLGLKTLAKSGFTALKAEPLAKAMGVSRGSFYWHFADIGAFHAAILARWREVATEQIIAGVEAAKDKDRGADPLAVLMKLTFGSKLMLEKAVRQLGRQRCAGPRRGRGRRSPPARLYRELLKQAGLADERRSRPGANPVLGFLRLTRLRTSRWRRTSNKPCSTSFCGSVAH